MAVSSDSSSDSGPISDSDRLLQLATPLSAGRLVLLEFSGSEHVNAVGQFRLVALCAGKPLDNGEIDKLLGGKIQITDRQGDSGGRQFVLTCFGLRWLGSTAGGTTYELDLRPWIWVMAHRKTSRIYPNQTVIDIVSEVLGRYSGLAGVGHENHAGTSFPVLEYTVQHQETDLDFVRRLLEEYGINFHVSMENGSQTLMLTTYGSEFPAAPTRRRVFQPGQPPDEGAEDFFLWVRQRQLTSGSVRMGDYNYLTPKAGMTVTSTHDSAFSPANLEWFEYPGRYPATGAGEPLAKRRLDGLRSADHLIQAAGHAPSLGAGMKFTPDDHQDSSAKESHVVLTATHHYQGGEVSSGGTHLGYHGEYLLARAADPIAPARVTPRPFVRGPQTAVVSNGGEAEVDEHGRIKVKFPWDEAHESLPCRVSQIWAGNSFGAQFIPRTGMEVLVDFVEGDPDRPVIVGCLYNGDNRYPGALPEQKTTSGITTQTVGGAGHNALIFDDKAGEEEVFVRAQRDLNILVQANEQVDIKGKAKRTVVETDETIVEKTLSLESYEKIELKVGASKITIDQSSITLSAPQITIDAQGKLTAKSSIGEISAMSILEIKAALVKIN